MKGKIFDPETAMLEQQVIIHDLGGRQMDDGDLNAKKDSKKKEDARSNLAGGGGDGKSSVYTEKQRKSHGLCKNFIKDTCQYGEKCRYYHGKPGYTGIECRDFKNGTCKFENCKYVHDTETEVVQVTTEEFDSYDDEDYDKDSDGYEDCEDSD